jgi:hypothetical protein
VRREELGRQGEMKGSRNQLRTEARRFGNVSLIALMLLSLCVLSLIRARFAPYSNGGSLYLSLPLCVFFCLYSHSTHLGTVSKELLLIMQGKQRKKLIPVMKK